MEPDIIPAGDIFVHEIQSILFYNLKLPAFALLALVI